MRMIGIVRIATTQEAIEIAMYDYDDIDDTPDCEDDCGEEDDFDYALDLCGLDDQNTCHEAGTEYCQFVCPFYDSWIKRLGEADNIPF
jgi:hypothetical protein